MLICCGLLFFQTQEFPEIGIDRVARRTIQLYGHQLSCTSEGLIPDLPCMQFMFGIMCNRLFVSVFVSLYLAHEVAWMIHFEHTAHGMRVGCSTAVTTVLWH